MTLRPRTLHLSTDGRLLTLNVKWGGHLIQLVNAYLPNKTPPKLEFINTRLVPVLAKHATADPLRLWAGDFNFDHNPSLDRMTRDPVTHLPTRPTATSTPEGVLWDAVLGTMVDAYRSLHPTGKDVSRYAWLRWPTPGQPFEARFQGAARLDRVYISLRHLQYLAATRPTSKGINPADITLDHVLVTGLLLARAAPALPPPGTDGVPNWPRRLTIAAQFSQVPDLVARCRVELVALIALAPTGDTLFTEWFQKEFKKGWRRITAALNREFQARIAALHAPESAAVVAAYEEMVAAEAGSELDACMEAYTTASAAQASAEALVPPAPLPRGMHQLRYDKPSPWISEWIHHGNKQGPVGVRLPSGAITTQPVRCASHLIDGYAATSAASATDPAATTEVLDALHQASEGALAPKAEELGDLVTAAEVLQAIDGCKPGTAPGPDGIPVMMFKLVKVQLAPLLVRFYNAMFTSDTAPAGFAHGIISGIPKETDPGPLVEGPKTRPITVLDMTYRILAKVHVNRLAPCMEGVIHSAQAAFIPGRSIADAIWLPQMVGALLECSPAAASVFTLSCDIAKAYDTLDRQFLWTVMEIMGVGAGFLRWCKLLYSNTTACVAFRGFVGKTALFTAGTRQGCPLAPLLFLFAIHALLVFLDRQVPRCVRGGEDIGSSAFADDVNALVASLDDVPAVEEAFATFGDASGLRLSVPKLKGYHIGLLDPGVPSYGAFQVVDRCRHLGITIARGSGRASANWTPHFNTFYGRCTSISHLNLSTLARARNVSAYGVSTLFFSGDYGPLPAPVVVDQFLSLAAKLVDAGRAPADQRSWFSGFRSDIIQGRLVDGGLGVTPILAHMQARQARWGLQLIIDATPSLPFRIGRHVLATCAAREGWKGFYQLQLILPRTPTGSGGPTLCRLIKAVRALPPLVLDPALPPGPWCYGAPLWGNPFILAGGGTSSHSLCLEDLPEAVGFSAPPSPMRTLGDLLRFTALLTTINWSVPFIPDDHLRVILEGHLGTRRVQGWGPLGPRQTPAFSSVMGHVAALTDRIRPDWKSAALAFFQSDDHFPQPAPSPSLAEAAAVLLAHLGWQDGPRFLPTGDYTVHWGTKMIHAVSDTAVEQRRRMAAYAVLALPPVGADVAPAVATAAPEVACQPTRRFLRLVQRLPWRSDHLGVAWRLLHNAYPLSARMTQAKYRRPCTCGFALPDRAHCFWECPYTLPVRSLIEARLQTVAPAGHTVVLQRHHIWLSIPPIPDLHEGAWCVVCVAALNAMDSTRCTVTRLSINAVPAGGSVPPSSVPAIRQQALRAGPACFWKLLHNFASARRPDGWRVGLSASEPFFAPLPHHPFLMVVT